ncbi:hypothetical protein [Chitinophaga sp. YIM B06452]|uniref:hypothetical protein n=1 Tax=Chitinophaga sp. YIM B06452 TaxID=3082158 RepID=UPI0031FE50EA
MNHIKKISVKELKKLINMHSGMLLEHIKKEYFVDAYELDNKKVVVDFQTHAFLYPDKKTLVDHIERLRSKNSTPSHILEEFGIKAEDFDKNKLAHVKYVEEIFGIDEELKVSNLKIIDSTLNLNKISRDRTSKLYLPLLVYTGEILIKELGGEANWVIMNSEPIEPIVICGGIKYEVFLTVYKELFEEYYEGEGIDLFDQINLELLRKGN